MDAAAARRDTLEGLRIRMLGAPRVEAKSGWTEVQPRKSFQALVILATSPQNRISRSDLAARLWPEGDTKGRLDSLRPCLSRLRGQVQDLGLAVSIETEGSSIKLGGRIQTDLDEIGAVRTTPSALDGLLIPVCDGWEDSVAGPIRRRFEIALAGELEARSAGESLNGTTELFDHFLAAYPLNARVAAIHVARLRASGHAAAALEVVERFELNWIDQFGLEGMPDIGGLSTTMRTPAESVPTLPPGSVSGKLHPRSHGLVRRILIAALPLLLACLVVANYILKLKQPSRAIADPTLAPEAGRAQPGRADPVIDSDPAWPLPPDELPNYSAARPLGDFHHLLEFVQLPSGRTEFGTIDLDSLKVNWIPMLQGEPYGLSYSPATHVVVFGLKSGGFGRIYAMKPDGTDVRRIDRDGYLDGEPTVSPDGKQVCFARFGKGGFDAFPGRLIMVPIRGMDERVLPIRFSHPKITVHDPKWGPDGLKIAFVLDYESFSKVYSVSPNGGEPKVLFPMQPGHQIHPSWSPDGAKIAFVTDDGLGKWHLELGFVRNGKVVRMDHTPREPYEGGFFLNNESLLVRVRNQVGRTVPYGVLEPLKLPIPPNIKAGYECAIP